MELRKGNRLRASEEGGNKGAEVMKSAKDDDIKGRSRKRFTTSSKQVKNIFGLAEVGGHSGGSFLKTLMLSL